MSDKVVDPERRARMVEVVRLVVSRRERAPRSPRMERALKRLVWRYNRATEAVEETQNADGEK